MNYICSKQGKIDKLWGRFIKHLLELEAAGIKVEYIRKGEVILNGKRFKPVYKENTMSWEPMGWGYEPWQNYITFIGYDISPLIKYLTKDRGKNGLPLEGAVEECFGANTPENYEKGVRFVASLGKWESFRHTRQTGLFPRWTKSATRRGKAWNFQEYQ